MPHGATSENSDLVALAAEIQATRQLLANLDGLAADYGPLFDIIAAVARERLPALEAALNAAGAPPADETGVLQWFIAPADGRPARRPGGPNRRLTG
jgi:hypothetical protein